MTERTVLITGCSSGIGRATAEVFLAEGWTVYATSRDTDDVADLAERGCRTASLDVTVDADIERVVDRIDEEAGHLDCLVNNAGYGQYGPLEDLPVERLHAQFDVNVYGPHRLTRAVLPLMRAQGNGTIVNVSSFYGRLSMPGSGAYAASKFALEAMSDALRTEVDSFGVDVVLVEPGLVDTGFNDRLDDELAGLDRSPEYDWLYETVEEFNIAADAFPLASSPAEAATVINDAASLSDPNARYTVGPTGRFLVALRYLPARYQDLVYRLIRRFA